MRMHIENKDYNTHCPMCARGCLLTNPQCIKGVKYRQKLQEGENTMRDNNDRMRDENTAIAEETKTGINESSGSNTDEKVMKQFLKCTHLLQHRKGHHRGQGRILGLLLKVGPIKQKELQELAEVRSSTMSEMLMKLLDEGFITREKSEEDKRVFFISLTEEGKAVAMAHNHRRSEYAKQLFDALDEGEKETLITLLEKLSTAWESTTDDVDDANFRGFGRNFEGFHGKHKDGHGKNRGGRHAKMHHKAHHTHMGKSMEKHMHSY